MDNVRSKVRARIGIEVRAKARIRIGNDVTVRGKVRVGMEGVSEIMKMDTVALLDKYYKNPRYPGGG